jgi:hypothetical protein
MFFIFTLFYEIKKNAWRAKLGILFSQFRPHSLFQKKDLKSEKVKKKESLWNRNTDNLISSGPKKHGGLTFSMRKHV